MDILDGLDHWLPRGYYIAQIAIVPLAFWAGSIALRQLRALGIQRDTDRLFQLLQQLEQPHIRDARYTIMTAVGIKHGLHWWAEGQDAERLHRAAAQVCGSFGILGAIIQFDGMDKVGLFFLQHWGEPLVKSYEKLEEFIAFRRLTSPLAYSAFSTLYLQAKKLHPTV